MFGDRWKSFFGGGASEQPKFHRRPTAPADAVRPRRRPVQGMEGHTRHSRGMEQFFHVLRDTSGLSILDLSAASQANISYITNLGHRIYAEDLVHALDGAYPEDDFFAAQADPRVAQQVIDQCLNFPAGHFDGALVWDSLQYMNSPLLDMVIERLYQILRPNAYVLAFFSSDERATEVPHFLYRIADHKTLTLTPQEFRPPAQHFSSRHIERIFEHYQPLKFFLARDHLREVLVKR